MEKLDFEYKISITGDLGSGKSTVCGIISKRIGAEIISIGTIQRAMAKEMNMTTYEFNHYMETHPEIDDKFDTMLKSYDGVFGKNMLFDSRLAWNFVPSAFSVYLTTDLKEAARRVFCAKRENEGYDSVEEAMQKLADRRASEITRYKSAYGLTIKDMTNYDFVVDSTTASPEEVVDAILFACKKFSTDKKKRFYISPSRLYPLSTATEDGDIKVVIYNDFYFVTAGINNLKKAIEDKNNLAVCELDNLLENDKVAYIANNCSISSLKQWEKETGINLIRYPL